MSQVCDVCGRRVEFSGPRRTYEHAGLTSCTGIDGIVLGVSADAWAAAVAARRADRDGSRAD